MLGLDACVRVLSSCVFICPFHWVTNGFLMFILPELWLLVTDHASLHHLEELWKLDCPVPVQVHLHHQLVEFVLGGVLAHGAHHIQQLLRRNSPTPVLKNILPFYTFIQDDFLTQNIVSHPSLFGFKIPKRYKVEKSTWVMTSQDLYWIFSNSNAFIVHCMAFYQTANFSHK